MTDEEQDLLIATWSTPATWIRTATWVTKPIPRWDVHF